MKEFPNKILLSQNRESKEILDYWVLHDYTDNITKEYVQLDKVIEWIKEHLKFEENGWHTDNEDFENVKAELIKKAVKEKFNTLYEYDVYYIHDNQSYVFKVAALNKEDARYRASHALRIYEDLKIYDVVKI